MRARLALVKRYIRYLLTARSAHGIHSPFVFHFATNVLHNQTAYYIFQPLSVFRKQLELDTSFIQVKDHGAGSKRFGKDGRRRVNSILKHSVKAEKYARLLFRIIQEYRLENRVELGTSLGITTLYLSYAQEGGKVFTVEADRETMHFAEGVFERFNRKNIQSVNGLFKDVVPGLARDLPSIDFAFIDGHHTAKATLENFELLASEASEKSVFAVDDIHWSEDMEEAWNTIKIHPKVSLTIDLFETGLVFFHKRLQREHFTLRF